MPDRAELHDPHGPREGADGDAVPPMLPSRTAYLLAFAAVVLAGLFGAVIGYGVTDTGSDSDTAKLLGTLVGAVLGAGGVGIVAILVLRAMSEWRRRAS